MEFLRHFWHGHLNGPPQLFLYLEIIDLLTKFSKSGPVNVLHDIIQIFNSESLLIGSRYAQISTSGPNLNELAGKRESIFKQDF